MINFWYTPNDSKINSKKNYLIWRHTTSYLHTIKKSKPLNRSLFIGGTALVLMTCKAYANFDLSENFQHPPQTQAAYLVQDNQQQNEQPKSVGSKFLQSLLDDELIAQDIESSSLTTPDLYVVLQAEFAADRGEIDKALTIYKSESFKKNATNVFERALALSIEFEQPSDSLTFAAAWQRKNPDHIPAWFYVTHLAIKAGEYRQAASMLSTILNYDPRADLAQILTGIIPAAPNDQRALFMALQELGQDNASVSVLRAGLLMNLGEYQAALLHVNHALTMQPKNYAFIALKLDILRANGRFDELWSFLHQARKQLPEEKELYLYEVRHLIEEGNLDRAWELLTLANQQTKSADVSLLAGLVGLDSERFADAIIMLKPLLNNANFSAQAHYYTAIGYERLGDVINALKHYEQVDNYELALDATTKAVDFYLARNNPTAAIKALVKLRDRFLSYATDSYILQAEIYLRQGNQRQAKDLLTLANRENPDDDRLLFASLKLLDSELDDEDKRQTIAKLLEIDNLNPSYQLASAKFRLSKNPDDTQALKIAQEILQIPTDYPDYDEQLQYEALLVLANHALLKQEYLEVINYLQTSYHTNPTLQAGIVLVRAYQGLGDQQAVATLLFDLQDKFGNKPKDTNP